MPPFFPLVYRNSSPSCRTSASGWKRSRHRRALRTLTTSRMLSNGRRGSLRVCASRGSKLIGGRDWGDGFRDRLERVRGKMICIEVSWGLLVVCWISVRSLGCENVNVSYYHNDRHVNHSQCNLLYISSFVLPFALSLCSISLLLVSYSHPISCHPSFDCSFRYQSTYTSHLEWWTLATQCENVRVYWLTNRTSVSKRCCVIRSASNISLATYPTRALSKEAAFLRRGGPLVRNCPNSRGRSHQGFRIWAPSS